MIEPRRAQSLLITINKAIRDWKFEPLEDGKKLKLNDKTTGIKARLVIAEDYRGQVMAEIKAGSELYFNYRTLMESLTLMGYPVEFREDMEEICKIEAIE